MVGHTPNSIADLAMMQVANLAIATDAIGRDLTPMDAGLDLETDVMTPKAIGTRLRVIREAYGLKKAEIADMLEIDRTHWSRFENGTRAIPLEKAYRLVERFDVTMDFIVLGRPNGLSLAVADRLRSAARNPK